MTNESRDVKEAVRSLLKNDLPPAAVERALDEFVSDMSGCSGSRAVAVSMKELTLGAAKSCI